jgi:alpha-ribazole phosphatase
MKERLADKKISACYTSDLIRCATGGEIIGSRLGLTPVRVPGLRELDIGVWEGKTLAELMEKYPLEWQARIADIVNYRVPGKHERPHAQCPSSLVERHRGGCPGGGHGGKPGVLLDHRAPFPPVNIEQDYSSQYNRLFR